MNIRPYRSADQSAVIALFRAFMQELTPPELKAQFDAYVERAIREELSRIESYYGKGFWVAEEADGVIGMVGIERHAKESAELRRMAVASTHRRRGIGRALLATAEDFCRQAGYRKMVLSTSELQGAAMHLYETSGYRVVLKQTALEGSHKTVGAGLTRYHFEKPL